MRLRALVGKQWDGWGGGGSRSQASMQLTTRMLEIRVQLAAYDGPASER